MTKILLGVTGSIAAYKAPELVRELQRNRFEVKIILTTTSQRFVSTTTLKTVAKNAVYCSLFDDTTYDPLNHINLARWAELVIVAPASANFIAKLAAGLCDDLLSTVCLATQAQVILVPAMNSIMWNNLATQNNLQVLQQRGIVCWKPDYGEQVCKEVGLGRMSNPDAIVEKLLLTYQVNILSGLNILVAAGGTQEPIDPVRYIGNSSSGKMGYAIAEEAAKFGANVTLVTSKSTIPIPTICQKVIHIKTAVQMEEALHTVAAYHDIFISAAAIGDYRIAKFADEKIKRNKYGNLNLQLVANSDILAGIAKTYPIFCVGFAAETTRVVENAKKKFSSKFVDLMIANDVSRSDIGFYSNDNEVYLITRDAVIKLKKANKKIIAQQLLGYIYKLYLLSNKKL